MTVVGRPPARSRPWPEVRRRARRRHHPVRAMRRAARRIESALNGDPERLARAVLERVRAVAQRDAAGRRARAGSWTPTRRACAWSAGARRARRSPGVAARRRRSARHRARVARAARPRGASPARPTLRHADGSAVSVQWGATTETVTGRRLVLFVALSTSRWGGRFRRATDADGPPGRCPGASARSSGSSRWAPTGPEIADELHITHDTVRTHVRNAMEKVGARSRAHLVAKALGSELLAAGFVEIVAIAAPDGNRGMKRRRPSDRMRPR